MRFFAGMMFLFLAIYSHCEAQDLAADSLNSILKTLSGDSQRAAFLNGLSLKYRNSDVSKSLALATQAANLAEKAGVKSEFARGLVYSGVELYYMGEYSRTAEVQLKALKIYEETGDKKGLSEVLNEIGIFNKKNGDTAKARTNFQRAFEISTSIHDSTQMANSMNHLGLVYELRNDDARAMQYFLRSAMIKESMHDLHGASYNYDNMGGSLTKQGRYKEAAEYFDKAIAIRRKIGDKTGLSISINNVGELYLAQHEPAKARPFFLEALALSFDVHYMDLRNHIYNMLSETYQKENNYKKAYEYFVKSTQVKDSIYNDRVVKQTLDLQTRYETEKKENEILVLKEQNDLKDYKIKRNTIYIVGLVMLVPVLVLLGYLWQNRIKLKQVAELETTRAVLRENQLQAVIISQEKERKRFAADLHDGLGQMISALRLSLSKENPEKNIVDHALHLLNEMNGEIRNIAFNLMPQVLMKGGLEEALQEFAGRVNRFGNVHITVSSFDVTRDMASEEKIALYRICQEWVNNAMKYSGCKNISVALVQHPDELVIIIEDDGKGFDKNVLTGGEGNGWKNISSRLAMLKGNIEIDSRPGHAGTTAVISSPGSLVIA